METVKRVPLRNILIFGVVATALHILAAFYNPYTSMLQDRSILLPVLVVIVTLLPLALFLWALWLRTTVPPLLRAGILTGAIGAAAAFVFQIFYYAAWINSILPGKHGVAFMLRLCNTLLNLSSAALYVGVLLMGVAFLRHPRMAVARGGLCGLIGGGLGCLAVFLTYFNFFPRLGISSRFNNGLLTLLTLAAWVLFLLLLISLLQTQPAPPPAAGGRPGPGPQDNVPHY